jgi:hypothetical protein
MGLSHLPQQTRHNDRGYADIFNKTWGHMAPEKNTSYKGVVRFVITDHSEYGCQPIILEYDFPNLHGPYIHDELFESVCGGSNWENLETGVIYERFLTFRNYRFYYGKVNPVCQSLESKIKA